MKKGRIMPIRTLADAISDYGNQAYLLTVAKDGPHASNVTIWPRNGCNVGAAAARNIAREPSVSLFWPPTEPGGYALIVNGTAASERRPAVSRWQRSHSRNRCCIVRAPGPTTATGRARPTVAPWQDDPSRDR